MMTYGEWISGMIFVVFFLLNFRNHTPFCNLKLLPFLPIILDNLSPTHCLAIRVRRPQPKPIPSGLAVIRGVHTDRGVLPSSPGGTARVTKTADLVNDWTREAERGVILWAWPCRLVLVPQTGATSVADGFIHTSSWCQCWCVWQPRGTRGWCV